MGWGPNGPSLLVGWDGDLCGPFLPAIFGHPRAGAELPSSGLCGTGLQEGRYKFGDLETLFFLWTGHWEASLTLSSLKAKQNPTLGRALLPSFVPFPE